MRNALAHARTNNPGSELRARRGIRTGIGNLGFAEESTIDANRRLQGFRRGSAACTGNPHAIFADFSNLNFAQVENNVGRKIR